MVVSNSLGSVISTVATLTVDTAPTIAAPLANQTVVVGETATFTASVSVTGTLPLTYQWFDEQRDYPGATSQSYTTPVMTQADNGDQFSVMVSNSLGTAPSNAATLTVVQPDVARDVLRGFRLRLGYQQRPLEERSVAIRAGHEELRLQLRRRLRSTLEIRSSSREE